MATTKVKRGGGKTRAAKTVDNAKANAKANRDEQKVAAAQEDRKAKANGRGKRTGAMERLRNEIEDVAQKLRDGAKMTEMRAEYGFGSGQQIRSELAKAGYGSKGEPVDVPTIPEKGKARTKALVAERQKGTPWYMLELATGESEVALREIVEEAGGPTGRVYRKSPDAKPRKSKGEGDEGR